MDIQKNIHDYSKLQKALLDHFGYKDDRFIFPLEDRTNFYWYLHQQEIYFSSYRNNVIRLIKADFDWKKAGVDVYSHSRVSTSLKGLYRSKTHTLVLSEPSYDGIRFLAIYDNAKRVRKNSKENQ